MLRSARITREDPYASSRIDGVTFQLYDQRRAAIIDFVPVNPGQVSIYHCGMTVQSAPHLGHIRKEVVFDVLRRWLEACGNQVTVVANITDIDDKILAKSASQKMAWYELAYSVELELHRAYTSLGCKPPTYEPRATGHIPEMWQMITTLIERGHAYVATDGSGDIYFDVRSWPSYGSLSNQRIDEMVAAADADPRGKKDPRDFALWKGAKADEPSTASWNSPWGAGRPGWHLECSAMATKYLGSEFDIHGGGIDLRFPHHENELAQAQAAGHPFARYWMHNAFVTMAGEKMSKSLGNGTVVTDLTQRYPARAVRMYLAVPHYRSTIEYSCDSLDEAAAQLERIDTFLNRAEVNCPIDFNFDDLPAPFVEAMNHDLGTPAAMAVIFDAIKAGNKAAEAHDLNAWEKSVRQVRAMLHIFGLDPYADEWTGDATSGRDLKPTVDILMELVLAQRAQARKDKDWDTADRIRDALGEAGITIADTPDGARWSL